MDSTSSNSTSMINDLTSGSVTKQLIIFATPLFFSNLLQAVYNMVDMIVVGHFEGGTGLSAVSIGSDVLHFLSFVAMGFSNAGQVIISQYIGAGQREKVSKLIGTMFTFHLSCAAAISILCYIFRGMILGLLNTPAESWDQALAYTVTCIFGLVFIYGYNIVSAILRGMGNSKHPFIFVAIAAVLNLILDLVFVALFHWGAFGAAFATVISQASSFIFALVFLYRSREHFGFDFKPESFRINYEVFKPLIKLGIPMAIQSASIQFSKLFVSSYINSYGVLVSAVTGIGNKLNTISVLFANSLTTAASSMIGQNIGAQKYDRVPRIMGVSFSINVTVTFILSMMVVLFPNQVFGIFSTEPDVLQVAKTYIPVAVLNFMGSAFRSPSNSLINGSGNSKLNFSVALFDGIIARIGLSMLFGITMEMGYPGFWYGSSLAGYVPFIIGAVYLISGRWKTRKHVIYESESGKITNE